MCREAFDRVETHSQLNTTEWSAEDLVRHLETLQHAHYYENPPTDSFRAKVDMLQARAKALEEEISKLNPHEENL